MFPRIDDLLFYLTGIHTNLFLQTYGLMMALAFLAGGLILRSELKRKEAEGMLQPNVKTIRIRSFSYHYRNLIRGVMLAILAWKMAGIILHYPLFTSNPHRYLFSVEGSLPVAVMVLVIYMAVTVYRSVATDSQTGVKETVIHPAQHTWNILFIAIVSAIAGSKLFDIIDNVNAYIQNPVDRLLSFSGFAFLGGLIITVVVLLIYVHLIRLDWKQVIDATAPAILLGYAIGRLGCHLSGDGCWGVINTYPQPDWLTWLPEWTWACRYPHNVINAGLPIPDCIGPHCHALSEPVFPTSLYESLMSVVLFAVVWSLRRRIKAPVALFGLFLVLFGTERLLIEQIRINIRHDLFGLFLSQAEAISALLIVTGIIVLTYFTSRYRRTTIVR
jgi:prolipoprotein diacylglyceryl transferase